uniref:C3H1-type domain-containing protein n=1 Tax=Anopheles melas TaxID=34690 RepID=A0A182TTF7_9DIPT
MKPQPEAMDEQPSKIFINPKFAKAHINPMFLASNGSFRQPEVQQAMPASHQSKIHLNPAFLNKLGIQQVMPPTTAPAAPALPAVPTVPQPQPPASHSKRNPTALQVHEKSATGKMGTIAYASKNKQLVLVNINGVLYRSSTNKLQKSVSRSGTAPSSSSSIIGHSPAKPARKAKEHFLIIRGVRFALDRTGMKLRSVGGTTPPTAITGSRGYAEPRLNRIDIGGLTYKARKDGTFIRTDSHRTRNHLSVAKQRSIQVLASKLKKCNEPCHIYRRLGKCLAHQRGKCPKVHDPKHVSICQRFLRGECLLDGCLLSHDITSLEKMPVCRFFLEGRCVREPCPYLHKKVSESVRICDAFLNGFCSLADKCPNRHVFQCPTFEQEGKCDRARCPYPHGKKESRRKQDKPSTSMVAHKSEPKEPATVPHVRYYKDEGQSLTVETEHRSETGELMSASERNQLKRMLGEVDKMKQRHRENDDHSVATENRPAEGNEQIVSMPETAPTLAGGDRSDACYSPSEPTPDDPMNDSDGVKEVGEEDTRPPALRRKALGPLPAFIPI